MINLMRPTLLGLGLLSSATLILIDARSASACTGFWGSLDPTCPGRIFNPRPPSESTVGGDGGNVYSYSTARFYVFNASVNNQSYEVDDGSNSKSFTLSPWSWRCHSVSFRNGSELKSKYIRWQSYYTNLISAQNSQGQCGSGFGIGSSNNISSSPFTDPAVAAGEAEKIYKSQVEAARARAAAEQERQRLEETARIREEQRRRDEEAARIQAEQRKREAELVEQRKREAALINSGANLVDSIFKAIFK